MLMRRDHDWRTTMVGRWLWWRMVGLALALVATGFASVPASVGQAADTAGVAAPPVAQAGRWIDVRLSQPTLVTAFEGNRIVYEAYAIRGTQGWETPTGTFYIQRRVANERMIGPGYDVSGVLFTQYFTELGHSLHYNYWSGNFGGAGSHGCLGMGYGDSLFFWEWATVGTPIVIHW